jgi:hypothetical protein
VCDSCGEPEEGKGEEEERERKRERERRVVSEKVSVFV